MDNISKAMMTAVNRNHERRRIMDKIDKDLDIFLMAKRLNQIASRRKRRR